MNIKLYILLIFFGWFGMPLIANVALNSVMPEQVKAITQGYDDLTLAAKCSWRNRNK